MRLKGVLIHEDKEKGRIGATDERDRQGGMEKVSGRCIAPGKYNLTCQHASGQPAQKVEAKAGLP